jgi:hypothetical protein
MITTTPFLQQQCKIKETISVAREKTAKNGLLYKNEYLKTKRKQI